LTFNSHFETFRAEKIAEDRAEENKAKAEIAEKLRWEKKE
jgi:hypothetical protein